MKTGTLKRGRGNALFALATAIVIVAGLIGLRQADTRKLEYDQQTLEAEARILSDTVYVGGIACVPKRNIRSYLIMGIDDTASRGENYVKGGQSDVMILLVVDFTNMTYQRLPINRNTLCQVRSYDVDGEDLGTSECQIALAYAQGDGGQSSCENAVEALTGLLPGSRVDQYAALKIEDIPVINRLAGGVTVTIEDDFSGTDPSLVKGETVTLTDRQAVTFVRSRLSMAEDDTNEARMRRQEAYLEGLRQQMLSLAEQDPEYALEVYNALSGTMVSNMDGKAFSRLVNGLTECEDLGTLHLSGEIGVDDLGYATFRVDTESLRDAIIALFFRPVDEEEAA